MLQIGRCISLLKILLSNACIYDCVYCANRCTNSIPRATFSPKEVADLTINFYKRNYIEGLFLSSGVIKNPDYTMELIYQVVYLLRNTHNFNGYIHTKSIPGCSKELINKVGMLVDRMSINIELPSNESLKLLAPQKEKIGIIDPMNHIAKNLKIQKAESKFVNKKNKFVPAGQTTQLMVGASPESDLKIITLSENLYKKFSLKRVYYSAYVSVNSDINLPTIEKPPMLRENRLYQADWLLRFYGFKANELLNETNPNFNHLLDPKCDWALRNIDKFPIDINKVDYFTLLRTPGIGMISAKRIVQSRRTFNLTFKDLKKFGVVLKRARYFITCSGKYYDKISDFKDSFITMNLLLEEKRNIKYENNTKQLSIFNSIENNYSNNNENLLNPTKEDKIKCLTGAL